MEYSIEGEDGTVGAIQKWKGDPDISYAVEKLEEGSPDYLVRSPKALLDLLD